MVPPCRILFNRHMFHPSCSLPWYSHPSTSGPPAVDKRLQHFRSSPVDVAHYSQPPHASAKKTTVLPLDAAFDSHIGSNEGSNMLQNVSITASSQRRHTCDAETVQM
mmetsp:Transcript_8615/g.15598  ORF Transcript_8615/g.15598 Transcript_8615/m.15598 type:complete len:107 (+) Transcript_8615:554-874(+)